MIIPDTNLLIYAHDQLAPQHRKAHDWWTGLLSGTEPIGIPWVVLLAFTRLLTHPNICQDPLTVSQVRGIATGWFELPHVKIIHVSEHSWPRFFQLLEEAGIGGNLSTDALIALHAMEHSATIHSHDRDFDRFGGVRRFDPLI